MTTLLAFVILYLLVSIGIGLYAATRVHSAKDFAVAGRSLPLPVVTATVFATWFGAEAVFGVEIPVQGVPLYTDARLYAEAGLQVRRRRRKKVPVADRCPVRPLRRGADPSVSAHRDLR